ncbi:MAG: SpoIIE family protein phosphatase [Clostridia bacterium]|nr:SpoIIE family protein phosphatase [Clostridia bacterium]
MVDNYLQIENTKDKINAELKTATNIQKDLLPRILPDFPGRCEFDVFASMTPAKEVGGDFYDFYFIDDDHFVFTVADVSGKGVPAALFMVIAKTILKNNLQLGMDFENAIEKSNYQLSEGNDEDMFVTAWLGVLEISSGKLAFMNCGHNPPVVLKQGEHPTYLTDRSGFVLAGMKTSKYKPHTITLEAGDKIFVYTDGVTEATNGEDELYGEDRLLKLLAENRDLSPEEAIKEVKGDIDLFVGDREQFDDITMLELRYNGSERIIKTEEFPATIEAIEDLTAFVEKVLTQKNASPKAISELNIVIDELFGNIAKYAYDFQGGRVLVSVEVADNPLKAIVKFEDGGKMFNPLEREDPNTNLSADERDIGGLGILVVKKMVNDIDYKYEDGKNVLTITKEI